jgi:hypothetical protein
MRKLDIFVIAAWSATAFGLLEGVLLNIARAYPALLAPYKASAQMLWLAPVVDLPLFLLAAVGLLILFKLAQKWTGGSELLITYSFFIFLGIFTLAEALKIIHLASAALLSVGLTVVFCRKLRGSEHRLTDFLRRRLVWIPVLLVVAALGVYGYEQGRESWEFHQLSTAPVGASEAN